MKNNRKFFVAATSAVVAISSVGAVESTLANTPENAEDVKNVLATKGLTPEKAETKVFKHYDNESYKEQFMMDRSNIKSITTNGAHYAQAVIGNATDGNLDTYWETRTGNSDTFKNEVVVDFKEAMTIDGLTYGARPSDNKGFAQEFDVYISPTSDDADFELVATGAYGKTSGLIEVKFNPTEAKKVKFVYKKSDQNWATMSEFMFLKEDKLSNTVNDIFTDGTMSVVVPAYDTIEKLEALEGEIANHPLQSELQETIDYAKTIVNGEYTVDKGTILEAEQVGNRKEIIFNQTRTDVGSNLQPTGLAVKAGKTITVYVEAKDTTKLPTMVFSQTEGAWSNWSRSVQLSPGKNVITVPEVPKDNKYHYDVTKGGMIYITNPYTKEQQGEAPVIRIEGADKVPYMTKDTDPEEFKTFLAEYKEKMDADVLANPDVLDRQVLDVVEIVSDHVIYTGTATNAYNAYITQNKDPKRTVDSYDTWMHQIFEVHGLDDRSELHSTDLIREPIRIMQPWGFMYAAGDHTGIQKPQEGLMFGDFQVNYPGWGLNHEIGHRIDLGVREWSEVTNNMTSMHMSIVANNLDNRIPYENIYKYVIGENKAVWSEQGLAERLGAFWQLELAHDGYWAELESLYRENKVPNGNEETKQQTMIRYSSDVLQKDLSSHFARHGFIVTEETKAYTAQYEEASKLWYLNNTVIDYTGDGFTENPVIDVDMNVNAENNTNTIKLAIDKGNAANLLGYEIYRDGVLVGFTAKDSFVDSNIDPTVNYNYEIIAYDKKLNILEPLEVQAFKTTIEVKEQVRIAVGNEFEPLNYAKAYDYKGTELPNALSVTSSTVDTSQTGVYQVVYTTTDQDVPTTKTLEVKVVEKLDYLSDLQPTLATTGWRGLQLDIAPEGTPITLLHNGENVVYEKGLGAHANSTIVYNVEGKGYDFFESIIGIDQAMKGKPSSAYFEVWVDDVKQYTSSWMDASTPGISLEIPITGASEVKLVTTDANHRGNESDHTVWADAKFIK